MTTSVLAMHRPHVPPHGPHDHGGHQVSKQTQCVRRPPLEGCLAYRTLPLPQPKARRVSLSRLSEPLRRHSQAKSHHCLRSRRGWRGSLSSCSSTWAWTPAGCSQRTQRKPPRMPSHRRLGSRAWRALSPRQQASSFKQGKNSCKCARRRGLQGRRLCRQVCLEVGQGRARAKPEARSCRTRERPFERRLATQTGNTQRC